MSLNSYCKTLLRRSNGLARVRFPPRGYYRWPSIQCVPLALFLSVPLSGQDQPPVPSQAPVSQQSTAGDPATSGANRTIQPPTQTSSHGRLFFFLPNFLTLDNADKVPPLTAGQKFKTTARNAFDPAQFGWYAVQAGISQLNNSNATYGQGAQGYAKRFALRFSDGTIENFFTHAIFPSILHQDPRYYRLGKGGFWKRAGYAISRIAVTRSDAGTTQFNFSEVLGSASSASLSAFTYHPDHSRNLHSALGIWGTQVGYDTLSFAVKEFWPDISKKIHHSK